MRPVPAGAPAFISKHEGCRLTAYPDPATGGDPWTIGYGHTGPEVVPGYKITKDEALELLAEDLKTSASRLHARVKRDVIDCLTDNQYAALLSFVFNLGANPDWKIWKRLNARQFDQVPLEMMKFVNAGGRKLQGLVNRRAAEVQLWSLGEPGSEPTALPSSVTRSTPTPPTPAEPRKSLAKSGTVWSGATVAVGGVVTGAQQVQALVAPQAQHSEWLGKMMGLVAVLIVVGGCLIMLLKYLDHKQAAK